ncbi:MAG: hypothetical protein JWM86_1250 [Thermoleophilia bacterium]|nr:hypothetical protein [Thermoleophilia bacterium]
MTASFASQEWAGSLATRLQESAKVRTESVTWIFGPIVLVVDADEAQGTAATALRLDVHEGSVRGVSVVSPDLAGRVPFAIGGSIARWQSVFGGALDLVDGALEAKLRVRGDLPTLARHRALLQSITAAGGEVETDWPVADAPAR